MKQINIAFLLIFSFSVSFSQTIERKVLPATGGNSTNGLHTSFTIGETFTHTLSNSDLIVTQGFQQPDSSMTVNATITTNSALSFCEGDSVILSANTGTDLLYQWLRDGIVISGATEYQYIAHQAGSYTVRVSNSNNFFMVSNPVVVGVFSLPVVGSTVSPSSIVCGGSSAVLSGTGALTYTWSGGISDATPFVASSTTTFTVTGTDANGCTATSTTTLTVKTQPSVTPVSNQTYCNGQMTQAIPLTGLPLDVVFDITGGVSRGLPNQSGVTSIPSFTVTSAGTATISITPSADGCTGPVSTYTMTVSNCPPVAVNLKFFIQGYYLSAGLMQQVLYNEGETADPNSILTDYVIVELHATTPPYAMVKTTIATLKTNGTLSCSFSGSVTNTPYYIVLHHRNSISTWSAEPVIIQPNMTYDFSTAASKAYGNNQKDVSGDGTVWALYNGDINQDENVDLLDLLSIEIDISDYLYGYVASDINGDGNVDLLELPLLESNISEFVFAQHP